MPTKDLILVVAPNDPDIHLAVHAWEVRGYDVTTHPIANLKNVTQDILSEVRKFEDVRILFTESAWGNIPQLDRIILFIDCLWVEPNVRWIHWSKKKKPTS